MVLGVRSRGKMVRVQVQLSKSTAYRLTAFEIHKLFLSPLFPQQQSAQSLSFCTQREKNGNGVWNCLEPKKNEENRKLNIYSFQRTHSQPLDTFILKMYSKACWGSLEEFAQDLKGQSIPVCPLQARTVNANNSSLPLHLDLEKFHHDSVFQGIFLMICCLFTTLQVDC